MSKSLPFKPFDERGQVRIYYNGFLPHWRQTGCTYFVTFRLADSIPQKVLDEWEYDRDQWLAARGIDTNCDGWTNEVKRLSPEERREFERHFARKLFAYLDKGHGECQLRHPAVAKIAADAVKYFHRQRLDTGDHVVMPNHIHALMTPYAGYELEGILHSVKSYTANQINKKLGRAGTFWMDESHDHIVRDGEELLRIQDYIRKNPQKANLKPTEFNLHTTEYDLK